MPIRAVNTCAMVSRDEGVRTRHPGRAGAASRQRGRGTKCEQRPGFLSCKAGTRVPPLRGIVAGSCRVQAASAPAPVSPVSLAHPDDAGPPILIQIHGSLERHSADVDVTTNLLTLLARLADAPPLGSPLLAEVPLVRAAIKRHAREDRVVHAGVLFLFRIANQPQHGVRCWFRCTVRWSDGRGPMGTVRWAGSDGRGGLGGRGGERGGQG